MKDNKPNPLKNFLKISTKCLSDDIDIKFTDTINLLFRYLSDEKVSQIAKSDILNDLTPKLKIHRYLSEYFSIYENQSIYLFLFDLYLMPTSQLSVKTSILNLINELRLNIEINKSIFNYLFQKLASIYRAEIPNNPEIIYNYLTLLSNILGSTDNYLKPRNYFSCIGNGNFSVDLSNKEIKIGVSFSIIINFKIAQFSKETAIVSKLIEINFSNEYSMDFNLQYPNLLIVKELNEKPIKTLPNDDWVNLIINVTTNENKLLFFFYVNGESTLSPFALPKKAFTKNDCINSISFFNNFYGETSSMVLLSQRDSGNPGVNNTEFLEEFKSFKEGIWKKKKLDKFIQILKNTNIVNKGPKKTKTIAENKTNGLKNTQTLTVEKEKNLSENIIFIFTPFNSYNNSENIIKNVCSSLELKYTGNIRPHKYQCYQKKLELMGVILNILPIAEMYIIFPQILTEKNLEILIQIITNIVKDRKKNMEQLKNCKFFKIFALFLEKYPESVFTSKILDVFMELGECMLKSNMDKLTSSYFEHILLNEKILSKYSENLQIGFWKQIVKFCQSYSSQIEVLVNMKRLSLILRFYDRNKYKEMCCSWHLNMIKDEFRGVSTIMNPPMPKKLAHLENIMNVIINGQSHNNLKTLFKILTLDLSPCLTKFILKIFITAFQNTVISEEWKKTFIAELMKEKFDVIIINTFTYSLPDVRLDILQLIFEIQPRINNNNITLQNLLKIIKFNILPQNNFYSFKTKNNMINIEDKKDKKDNNSINKPKNKFSSLIDKIAGKFRVKGNNKIKEPQPNVVTQNNTKVDITKDSPNYLKNDEGEILVLKEKNYYDYINNLMNFFIKLSLNLPSNANILSTDFKNCKIKNTIPLELLMSIINELDDNNYTMKTIQCIEQLSQNPDSAYKILSNEKIIFSLLTLAFIKYKNNKELTIYEKTMRIFLNSFLFAEVNNEKYPFSKIDNIFMWADKIIQDNGNIDFNENLNDFLNELLFECFKEFKKKNSFLINFDINSKDFNLNNNFNLKNYFIFLTQLFRFSFHFKHELKIKNEFLALIPESNNINDIINIYISGMRVDKTKEKISEYWKNYIFFDEIYKKLSVYWEKIKNFEKKKYGKVEKYQEILHKIIIDKHNKNVYQKELELLFFEEIINDKQLIIPFINNILITIMSMLSITKNVDDFRYWLKELKRLIRFIIIGSSNLIRTDQHQVELYNKLQEKCSTVLLVCLCFLKNLNNVNDICKEKVDKTITSIYILCFVIVSYQHNKHKRHKAKKMIMGIAGKYPRNDLSQCAVFLLFNDILKNQNNPIITEQKIELLTQNQYNGIIDLINEPEWTKLFYENKDIKHRVLKGFYTLSEYKKFIDERFELLKLLNEEYDEKYQKNIMELLPLYENELVKYSNNSLENNKKNKHLYKVYKKKSFSWGGYWSDRKLFYEKIENLKVKLINHYTKTLMKPILVPILDVSYYLPQFSGFDPRILFNDPKILEKNKMIMDIDKILKEKTNINNVDNKKTDIKNAQNENFLRKIYFKSNEELANKLSKIADKLDFGKEEEFTVIKDDSNTNATKYYLSCLVKTSHHIKGVCFLDNDNLNFKVFMNQKTGNAMSGVQIGFTTEDDDYDKDRQTCFGSYFVYHQKDKDLYKINIKYSDIKWIFRRKYYYKNSAFEIYTATNKSYYFNLKYEEDRETVLNEILSSMGEYAGIVDDMRGTDIIVGYINLLNSKKKKKIKLSKIIDSWKDWKITNYELLMWLNIFGNRSFNDISQYPVFPWILSNFEDPLLKENGDYIYREMTLPMGMMELNEEGEKRKELFMLNYETLKDDEEGIIKPYFFGSNYSNPVYVCTYLVRLFPFTHISIELQGKKFDDPNRLFISIENSFYNSTTQKTDVRELIPEFFYLPEMLLNINDLNMGILENGNKVNDVLTPCDNNPYEFIKTMKSILEGDTVSFSIQNWVDLIFGSKSNGEEAKNAHNLFSEASYQENIDFKKLENKESYLRLVEFGLIPSQVLNKDFIKKDKKEEIVPGINCLLKKNECKTETNGLKFYQIKNEISILIACESDHEKLTIILNNGLMIEKTVNNMVSFMKYSDKISGSLRLPNCYNYMSEFYSNNSKKNINKSVLFFNNAQKLIMAGFYDSKISIMSIKSHEHEKQIDLMPFNDDCPILSIALSQDEEYLFVGNSIGNILVYKVNPVISNWKIQKIITDQMSAISHIHCSSEMNLWCSVSVEGYVNIYTLPECKLIRSIKTYLKKCSYAFLSSSPLPAIIVINNDETSDILVYTINGKLISKKQENFALSCPIMMKDKNSNDYLAYIGVDEIIILNLPDLEINNNLMSLPGVYIICPSEDRKILYAINKNAFQVFVVKDDSKANKSTEKRSLSAQM